MKLKIKREQMKWHKNTSSNEKVGVVIGFSGECNEKRGKTRHITLSLDSVLQKKADLFYTSIRPLKRNPKKVGWSTERKGVQSI